MTNGEIIFLVRKQADIELLKGLNPALAGSRRLIVQVVGEANSLNSETLRRLRRATEVQKRRTPVVVWTATNEDAERWRMAGALAIVGTPSLKSAQRAIEQASQVPWIESSVYVGPDRRYKKTWLQRTTRRLDDENVGGQPDKAMADNSSFETRMRQLRFGSFGLDKADRARRAQFLADVRSAIEAAGRARRMHSSAAMESLARYIAARGATGSLDQALIEKHLETAEAAPTEAAVLVPRLKRSVDRVIGLIQPA